MKEQTKQQKKILTLDYLEPRVLSSLFMDRKLILSFLESPVVLIHRHDAAGGQKGSIFDMGGIIEYTPMNVEYRDAQSGWFTILGQETHIEEYTLWFDSSKYTKTELDGKPAREFVFHYEYKRIAPIKK